MFKTLIVAVVGMLLLGSPAMAACSVTNTFTNGTTADATQVNTNFSDLTSCAAPIVSPSFTGTASFAGGIYLTGNLSGQSSNTGLYTNGNSGSNYSIRLDPTTTIIQAGAGGGGALLMGMPSGGGTGYVCYTISNAAASYSASGCNPSAQRFKQNIEPLKSKDSLDALLKLRPVSFQFKPGMAISGLHFGMIAEEAEKVLPKLMTYENDGKTIHGINYLELVPFLIGAVQAQQAEIELLREPQVSRLIDQKSRTNTSDEQYVKKIADLQRANETMAAELSGLKITLERLERRINLQTAQR